MINEQNLLKSSFFPHRSEKVSYVLKKNNVIVLKIKGTINKSEIKSIVKKVFNIDILSINTLISKGKKKKYKQRIGRTKNWKKVYIKVKLGQNLEIFSDIG